MLKEQDIKHQVAQACEAYVTLTTLHAQRRVSQFKLNDERKSIKQLRAQLVRVEKHARARFQKLLEQAINAQYKD